MTRPLRFAVTLPQIKRTWQEARDAALELEELGYDALFVCDHLYGVPNPTLPIFEAWTELAAVGALTRRVELGTLVTPPFFRNPAVLAKQVSTLDHITGGRVIVGLGGGWFAPEFENLGLPFPPLGERLRALEETLVALRSLFAEARTTFAGRHVHLREAIHEPKPLRRPPILVGGGGERVTLRIAARHADIWNNLAIHQGALARKVEALRRHCEAVGRPFEEIEISQQCTVVIAEDEAASRAALEKAQRIFGGHLGSALEEHGIWGPPERVIERIEAHRALGCTGFMIEFFGRDIRVPARLFAEKVMPAFR